MKKLITKVRVKLRVTKPENKAGFGWITQERVTLRGDTIEELLEQAYAIQPDLTHNPDAIHVEGFVRFPQIEGYKHANISTFRELK